MEQKFGETKPEYLEKGGVCKQCGNYARPPYKLCWDCNKSVPDPKQEQIQWGQSVNCAVQMVHVENITDSQKRDKLEAWQKYFYAFLTRKTNKDGVPKKTSQSLLKKKYRTEATEKGENDAEDDMGEGQVDFGG